MKRFICILLLIIVSCPIAVHADSMSRKYRITNYDIQAQLQKNGSMDVVETIDYEFKGAYKAVYRNIELGNQKQLNRNENSRDFLKEASSYNSPTGLSNIDVYVDGRQMIRSEMYDLTMGNYSVSNQGNLTSITISNITSGPIQHNVIRLSYTLKNVAVKYNDIGEVYWNFIGSEWKCPIDYATIKIILPDNLRTSPKIFTHGPIQGSSQITDRNHIIATVKGLRPGQAVDCRVLFDKEIINQSDKVIKYDALNKIMSYEGIKAKYSNKERFLKNTVLKSLLTIVTPILLVVAFVYFYIKYDKEKKTAYWGEYCRDLPGNYGPAIVSYLLTFGNNSTNDILPTLLDLVRRKYLSIEEVEIEESTLFGTKKEKDYIFKKLLRSDLVELKEYEKHLINWLIPEESMSLKEFKESLAISGKAQRFIRDFDYWTIKIALEADKLKFIDKDLLRNASPVIKMTMLLTITISIFGLIKLHMLEFLIPIIGCITLAVYISTIKRRTQYGADQTAMWMSFKKFLLHFSKLGDAEIPSIQMWEHYLVYAAALGIADEVSKQLKIVINEGRLDGNYDGVTFFGSDFDSMAFASSSYIMRNIFNDYNTFNNIFIGSLLSTDTIIGGDSLESGLGGGFSGGGGGGAGGGGGGAF